jgi:hypothetical protein
VHGEMKRCKSDLKGNQLIISLLNGKEIIGLEEVVLS